MGDINIISHDQKGGITGQNVSISEATPTAAAPAPDAPPVRQSWWSRWGSISEMIALIVALITLYLTVF